MPQPRYDRFSVFLHWLMAVLIVGQIALGLWMTGLPKDGSGLRAAWFNVHKSWGMVLCLLIAVRLAWALLRPRVPPLAQGAARQRLASGAHRLLYALMLLVPLAGFLGSVFSGYPIRFYGLLLPQWSGRWDAAKALMAGVHHWSAWALLALAVLHVAATAHHQLVLRDGALRRMR